MNRTSCCTSIVSLSYSGLGICSFRTTVFCPFPSILLKLLHFFSGALRQFAQVLQFSKKPHTESVEGRALPMRRFANKHEIDQRADDEGLLNELDAFVPALTSVLEDHASPIGLFVMKLLFRVQAVEVRWPFLARTVGVVETGERGEFGSGRWRREAEERFQGGEDGGP